jgi:hypothetical protein
MSLLFTTALLTGCGGGGGGSANNPVAEEEPAPVVEQGEVLLALTDAEGDFLSYTVTVERIEMVSASGNQVSVLPEATELDFTQYVDVSELVAITSVPAGLYSSIDFVLDYTDAEIVVQDELGNAIEAEVLDPNGEMATEITVSLEFASDNAVPVTAGTIARVTLDFDLSASNDIEIDGDSATVTVEPFLVTNTEELDARKLRLRGLVAETGEGGFALDVLPFRLRAGEFGEVRVNIDDTTGFLIDDIVYEGDEGLAQLAELGEGAPAVAAGTWDIEAGQYTAERIIAGTSLGWSDADTLRGTVTARTANSLTISGQVLELADGTRIIDRELSMDLTGLETVVISDRALTETVAEAISVGSRIVAVGEFIEDNFSASSIRIAPTPLSGTVVTAEPLALDLQLLSARRPVVFDFAGTGTSADTDADPDFYEVDTSGLDTIGFNIGEPVRVLGQVSDFGQSPADFSATTLINSSELPARLSLGFGIGGSNTAVAVTADEAVTVATSELGLRQFVARAGIRTDIATVESLSIVPAGDNGFYALARLGEQVIYSGFDEFSAALAEELTAGSAVLRIEATGRYDDDLAELNSRSLIVVITQ